MAGGRPPGEARPIEGQETRIQMNENLTPDDMNALRRVRRAAIEGDTEARKRLKSAARSVERAEHRETVNGCAEYLKESLEDQPERDPHDVLTEVTDGILIGYSTAEAYLRASDNADAWDTYIGGEDPGVEARATYALESDVREAVRREHGGLKALADAVREGGQA